MRIDEARQNQIATEIDLVTVRLGVALGARGQSVRIFECARCHDSNGRMGTLLRSAGVTSSVNDDRFVLQGAGNGDSSSVMLKPSERRRSEPEQVPADFADSPKKGRKDH